MSLLSLACWQMRFFLCVHSVEGGYYMIRMTFRWLKHFPLKEFPIISKLFRFVRKWIYLITFSVNVFTFNKMKIKINKMISLMSQMKIERRNVHFECVWGRVFDCLIFVVSSSFFEPKERENFCVCACVHK